MTEQPNYDKMVVLDEGKSLERTEYTLKRKLHRTDGPARVWADGSKSWYQNGKLHRLDGPAIEWVDGDKFWYIDGQELTEKEFKNKAS